MIALSLTPQFHSAILSTLREGVIHLALPQPEIARQPDFPAHALQGLLGVTPRSRLSTRFKAAADLFHFATRNLPEADRPPVLAPLWRSEPWKPGNALMKGVLHYLEGVTKEACQVLDENSFQLSLQVWNKPDDPENWEVLSDHLEAQGWVGRRASKDALSAAFSRNFPKDSPLIQTLQWERGFLTWAAVDDGDHERALRRFQLVPETRFTRSLGFFSGPQRWSALFERYSVLFLQQITNLQLKLHQAAVPAFAKTLPGSRVTELYLGINQIGDAGAQALANALPRSRVTVLCLKDNRIGDAGAQALADVLPKSPVTVLDLRDNPISDAMKQALDAVSQRTGIAIYC